MRTVREFGKQAEELWAQALNLGGLLPRLKGDALPPGNWENARDHLMTISVLVAPVIALAAMAPDLDAEMPHGVQLVGTVAALKMCDDRLQEVKRLIYPYLPAELGGPRDLG